jgi:DNA-binding transcriptional regulator YiaG
VKKKYQSKILGFIHEGAQSLYEDGIIDEKRMKEYDKDCLVPAKPKKTAVKPVSSAKTSTPPAAVYASPK